MITTSARRIAAVLAACLLAVLPAADASAAAPADGGQGSPGRTTFGVQPSAVKKPDARPNFSYGATPGALVKDHIAVFNYGRKPLTLRVYAQDAFTTDDGGFDLFAARHRPADVGSWIKLRKSEVKVPARSRVIVPFTLTVPAKATPATTPAASSPRSRPPAPTGRATRSPSTSGSAHASTSGWQAPSRPASPSRTCAPSTTAPPTPSARAPRR
nr:DUF916 domain-containing protein [Streptomyces chartreusis]